MENTTLPFLKWAGGKRWLTGRIRELAPRHYNRYFEPFLGSGAAFFALEPNDAVLSDLNSDLINCYLAIRDRTESVESLLEEHQSNHSKAYYYWMRSQQFAGQAERAAQFIYLNRTCWNGLYRVNRKGKFNVPIGTKTAVLMDTDEFEWTAELLRSCEIICSDFETTIDHAQEGDFIFVDPPYTVRHNLNGFIKYNERLFSWADQVRLKDALKRAVGRGAHILATNANHQSVHELYSEFQNRRIVSRMSVLAGDASYRSSIDELLIQA